MKDGEYMNENNSEEQRIKKQKMAKAGWIVALGIIVIYFCTVLITRMLNVGVVEIHIIGLLAILIILPIATFFLGIWITFKKKFYPKAKEQ